MINREETYYAANTSMDFFIKGYIAWKSEETKSYNNKRVRNFTSRGRVFL